MGRRLGIDLGVAVACIIILMLLWLRTKEMTIVERTVEAKRAVVEAERAVEELIGRYVRLYHDDNKARWFHAGEIQIIESNGNLVLVSSKKPCTASSTRNDEEKHHASKMIATPCSASRKLLFSPLPPPRGKLSDFAN
eukprot:scaffold277602_cov27-Tisochrysis_lutea.AAC.1